MGAPSRGGGVPFRVGGGAKGRGGIGGGGPPRDRGAPSLGGGSYPWGGGGVGGCVGSLRLRLESGPASGAARYGNEDRNGLSLRSTPSPSGRWLPTSSPPTTRSSMSTTSSASRRPFGKPAVSPAMTPNRFGFAAGGTPRLIFSVSAAAGLEPILVSPGIPVSSAVTMSVRLVSGTFSPG